MLYTADLRTLVACPPGIGKAVALDPAAKEVGPHAFSGCSALESIAAPGNVEQIDPSAFSDQVGQSAVVALAAGDDYDVRRAVWETAGFSRFATLPVQGSAATNPKARSTTASAGEGMIGHEDGAGKDVEAPVSGLSFSLRPDGTLAVSWEGAEGPDGLVEIPATAEVGGVPYRVAALADGAFAHCAGLTGVSLPDGVAVIETSAFEGTSLSKIVLPRTVQAVGSRAFADCAALARIACLGTVADVASDALSGCAGVSLAVPHQGDGAYAWNVGIPAAGNHLDPWALELSEEPLGLEVGQSAGLFDGGRVEAPAGAALSFSYPAACVSVDSDGTVSAKAPGTASVSAVLELDELVLARAERTVAVSEAHPAAAAEEPATAAPAASLLSADAGIMPLAAGTTFTQGNFTYTVLTETGTTGTVSVSKNAGNPPTSNINIPATVKNGAVAYTVTEVGTAGFSACNASSVTIPSTVTRLSTAAFEGIAPMTTVTIPASVTSVGANPFRACANLTSIKVASGSASFSSDGTALFDSGKSTLLSVPGGLSSYSIPSSVRTIATEAFLGCSKITAVAIPNGVTTIKNSAFYSCQGLVSLTIPPSVTSIEFGFITMCGNLASISTAGNTSFLVQGGVLYDSEMTKVLGVAPVSMPGALKIPETVTRIESYTFWGCGKLASIEIPVSVTYIGPQSFAGCTNLKTVICNSGKFNAKMIRSAFVNTNTAQIAVYLPIGTVDGLSEAQRRAIWTEAGFSDFKNMQVKVTFDSQGGPSVSPQQGLSGFVLAEPAAPTRKDHLFLGWYREPNGTTPWVFGSAVTANTTLYAKWAHSCDDGVLVYTLADGALTVRAKDPSTIVRADIPASHWVVEGVEEFPVAAIEPGGFAGAAQLASVSIPATVTTIGKDAFSGCTSLARIDARGAVASIGDPANPDSATVHSAFDASVKAKAAVIVGRDAGWESRRSAWQAAGFARVGPSAYTVHFAVNEPRGSEAASKGTMADQSLVWGVSEPLSANLFSCDYYGFAGWNTEPDGTGDPYTDAEAVYALTDEADGEVALYAQWAGASYTVSFDKNDAAATGQAMKARSYRFGVWDRLPSCTFKNPGHVFAGWTTEQDGSGDAYADAALVQNVMRPADAPADGSAAAVTLYARWAPALDVTVPLSPKIEMDAMGNVTADRATFFRSNNAATVKVAGVKCVASEGASKVFGAGRESDAKLTMALRDDPLTDASVRLGKEAALTGFTVPPLAKDGSSDGVLPVTFGLEWTGTRFAYVEGAVELCTLVWELEVVAS